MNVDGPVVSGRVMSSPVLPVLTGSLRPGSRWAGSCGIVGRRTSSGLDVGIAALLARCTVAGADVLL